MAKYKIMYDSISGKRARCVERDDGAIIPQDMQNADWLDYVEWCADGNTPDDGQKIAVAAKIVV